MARIAYLAHQFPSPLEPYVVDEIDELRACGVTVICSSARRPEEQKDHAPCEEDIIFLRPLRPWLLLCALLLIARNCFVLRDLFHRVLLEGNESFGRRVRALAHTWLGAYYSLLLKSAGVDHIHVHHGYFASWVGMVAARLCGATYSLTLHGSDMLVHRAYLDTKLQKCKFCITVSEFNRQRLLADHPQIAQEKIIVQRLGVDIPDEIVAPIRTSSTNFALLAVGRLHPVKDHAFLVSACSELKQKGLLFTCRIAGEGPERGRLQNMIKAHGLEEQVTLLGHLSPNALAEEYQNADLVVLTSRSEGIPLVLMEAMARGRIVLAPDITGIPELVADGRTGFLYCAGSSVHFVALVKAISSVAPMLGHVPQAARQHLQQKFNRQKNLSAFAEIFLSRVTALESEPENTDANSVLQQVQFSVQRH
jgi:glycosyltransferase involved in cell wall biosynthesis